MYVMCVNNYDIEVERMMKCKELSATASSIIFVHQTVALVIFSNISYKYS